MQKIALVLFFIFLFLLFTHTLTSINQDIGRHLASGKLIWETGQVYKTNTFSYTEPDQRFINHHWLTEVVFYWIGRVAGLKALILFKAFILTLTWLILWLTVRKRVSPVLFILISILSLFFFFHRADVRGEMFSYLFLAIYLYILFAAKNDQKKKLLWLLPLIQLAWTNMHIYFVLGPMIYIFFLIHTYFSGDKTWPFKKPLLIGGLILLATLINPNGLSGALAPFNILKDYGYSIVENQSIFFLKDYGIMIRVINFFVISVILATYVIFRTIKKRGLRNNLFEILTLTAMAILAAMMIRNTGPYAIVFVPVVSLLTARSSLLSAKWSIGKLSVQSVQRALLRTLSIVIVLLIFITISNRLFDWIGIPKQFGLHIPTGAAKGVDFVKTNNIQGPVFNNFDVGSFLIWKLYPDQKVFVDGRPEAYSVEFLQNKYIPMQQDPDAWKKYSEEYGINYVFFDHRDITPWARKFMADISRNHAWAPIYLDDSVVIFIKRAPQNNVLIDKFEIH